MYRDLTSRRGHSEFESGVSIISTGPSKLLKFLVVIHLGWIMECRCNGRLQTKRFTRLAHTGKESKMHHIDNPGSEGRLKREFFWGEKNKKKEGKKKSVSLNLVLKNAGRSRRLEGGRERDRVTSDGQSCDFRRLCLGRPVFIPQKWINVAVLLFSSGCEDVCEEPALEFRVLAACARILKRGV